jgi:predicted dehydrogenase
MKYLQSNRRNFLKGAAAASGGLFVPNLLLSQDGAASKKLAIACIGVGGKGGSDMETAAINNEIVAICDVDANNLANAAKKYPNAKQFRDFREMFAAMADKIDAVTVSTADHAHYPAAMEALKHGKHICVQKPLVNTLWEARELHKAARKKGVITQMGNQGHTGDGMRFIKEWIGQGIVGKVKEIHVWSNRPIWPQGNAVSWKEGEVPQHLDWKLWLAQSPDRPYSGDIHPFKWRGFREYGAGAMGDMGCHLLDGPFYALGLTAPTKIEAESEELTDIAWPKASKITCHFSNVPGHGDITLTWYDGNRKPERPKELGEGRELSNGGFLIVGEEGTLYDQSDYCQSPRLLNEEKMKAWIQGKPEKTLERSPAAGRPQEEWTIAIKNGKEFDFMSHVDYAVPLTELCLLGNFAITAGKPLEWDAAKGESNIPEANKYLKRAAYRDGYEYTADSI